MAEFSNIIRTVLASLGIEPSEARKLERVQDRLSTAKNDNAVRLEKVKEEIYLL